MSGFITKLAHAWQRNDSLLCIGLDPEIERFPHHILAQASPIFHFNKDVIDATADLVCAYKPQFAHYAAYEAEDQLERTIEYIHRTYPHIPVILDAKRGDVGNTAERYAIEAFERYGADAVTVNPYLGGDALEPFLRHQDKGIVILCRTSNPGAGELQDLVTDGRKLYQVVAQLAARRWNTRGPRRRRRPRHCCKAQPTRWRRQRCRARFRRWRPPRGSNWRAWRPCRSMRAAPIGASDCGCRWRRRGRR